MSFFQLNPMLKNDTFCLRDEGPLLWLLMNQSLVPWFILVPKVPVTELYQLSTEEQCALGLAMKRCSQFLVTYFSVDKVNVAALGNVVPQLHLHVVGRYTDDFCWPQPVWGQMPRESYCDDRVREISDALDQWLHSEFNS